MPRPITLTKRMKKLIILPCQSFCPNMGVNKFFSHKPGAKFAFPLLNIFTHHPAAWPIPREYHQSGKYTKSQIASPKIRCNINTNICKYYTTTKGNKKMKKYFY